MTDWIGRTLGQVRIDALLAHGGMADVYLGSHIALQRPVAVKFLRAQFQENVRWVDRFLREARAIAMLRHPNIIQIYDYNIADGVPYIVMEYVRGGSLASRLHVLDSLRRRLELPLVSRLLGSLSVALQYAHSHSVVHRDIKPGNILMTTTAPKSQSDAALPNDVEPVLSDFGLVRLLDAEGFTATGQIGGTPAYMSPEQASGDPADARSDIYSLGIVVYEILAGRAPFDAESSVALLLKQIHETPKPIPGLSGALQHVVDKSLAKDPAARYQTPMEFASAFQSAADETNEVPTFMGGSLIPAESRTLTALPVSRPKRWLALAAAGVAMFVVGASLFLSGGQALQVTPTADSAFVPPLISVTGGTAELPAEPAAVLRFQDGAAIMDKVTLTALSIPPPGQVYQFEVWLLGADEPYSFGLLKTTSEGTGSLSFVDSQSRNLLGLYDGVMITLEPASDPELAPASGPIYAFTLPVETVEALRALLVSSEEAPNNVSYAEGLRSNTTLLLQTAVAMLRAQQEGDGEGTRGYAEAMLNLIAGEDHPDHRDWNGDNVIDQIGDGFGLGSGAEASGYLLAVVDSSMDISHAPGATSDMIENHGRVQMCVDYLQDQFAGLREHLLAIATAPANTDVEPEVRSAVSLADQILNGFDADEDGVVEPVSSECGVLTTVQYAYSLADMPLYPIAGPAINPGSDSVDAVKTGTVTATTTVTSTPDGAATPTGAIQPTVPGLPTLPGILPTDGILPDILPTDAIPDILPSELPLPPVLETPLLDLP